MPEDNFVASMEDLFQTNFKAVVRKDDVIQEFVNVYNICILAFKHSCVYFPHVFFKTSFSPVRLFYSLKYRNRNFKIPCTNKKIIIWRRE